MLRRAELYQASVLAQLKPEIISHEMEDLDRQLYEIDHEDEIDELEKMAQANLERIRQIKDAKKKNR